MNEFEQLQRNARAHDRAWVLFVKSERKIWFGTDTTGAEVIRLMRVYRQ